MGITDIHKILKAQGNNENAAAIMKMIPEKKNGEGNDQERIVIIDPAQEWRKLKDFVKPELFHFFSLGDPHYEAACLNPCKIPIGAEPQHWVDEIISTYCKENGLSEREKQIMSDVLYRLYERAQIFGRVADLDHMDPASWQKRDGTWTWANEVTFRSTDVTLHKVYKALEEIRTESIRRNMDNETKSACERLCGRLACFSKPYSIEYRIFSQEDNFEDANSRGLGFSADEIQDNDGVTVFETYGLDPAMAGFVTSILLMAC